MNWFEKIKAVETDVLVLPGFNEGYSQRGAWFAWVPAWKIFLKKFSSKLQHLMRWNVYVPETQGPLSDGEIDYLVQRVNQENERYLEQLRLIGVMSDGQTGVFKKAGWLSLILYVWAIVAVQQWWLIYLTMPQFVFFNFRGERQYKKGKVARNVIDQFWMRGKDRKLAEVVNETHLYYRTLVDMAPLEKYQKMVDFSQEKAESNSEYAKYWKQIGQAYSDIIKKLTGRSYLVRSVGTSGWEKILMSLCMAPRMPEPENVFPVRNLDKPLIIPSIQVMESKIFGENKVDNALNIFLLRSRSDKLICVLDRGPFYQIDALSRSVKIGEEHLPLEANLYVGTEKEKALLIGLNLTPEKLRDRRALVHKSIQNASFDTLESEEAVMAWVMREVVPMQTINQILGRYGGMRGLDPVTNVIMAAFPWMFLANGMPVMSILALSWIFLYPQFREEGICGIREYFTTSLKGVKIGYHNMVANVKVNSALGHINEKIRNAQPDETVYQDIQKDINTMALPSSLMNWAIFNNVAMETPQLKEAQREACNFTFIPLEMISEDKSEEAK